MSTGIGYRDLWVERNYLKSFCAGQINRFGDSIDALAFAWMVYEVTGTRAWSAVIFGLNALPTITLMPFAGVLVERMDKRRVMIATDLGRAVLVGCVALLYALGRAEAWMLACSTLLMSTFEAFRIPAGLGIFPRLVPREKYTVASSLSQTAGGISVLLGTGAFGPVVNWFGLQGAMVVNAATFLLSAGLIALIHLAPEPKPTEPLAFTPFFRDLRAGFSYFYSKKLVFLICVMGSGLGALFVPLNALITPYVQEALLMGAVALSVMQGAMVAGNLLGAMVFPVLNRRFGRVFLSVSGGMVSAGAYFAAAAAPRFPAAAALGFLGVSFFVVGCGTSLLMVVINVVFMEQVEASYLGRVGGLFNSMAMALVPVTSFVVAGLAVGLRSESIFLVCGVLTFLLFILLGRSKLYREIESKEALPDATELSP